MPPEKYGRVSSAFLARHAIGREENSQEDVSEQKVPFFEPMQVGEERSEDYSQGPAKITSVKVAGWSPHSMSESRFLMSLAGLRREKPRGAGDDLDLLSDVDDVEDIVGSNVMGVKSVGNKDVLVGGNCGVSLERRRHSRSAPDSNLVSGRDARYGGGITDVVNAGPRSSGNARNLVSGADDSAAALISKLRDSQKKRKSAVLKNEETRRTARTRRSNENGVPDK